MTCVITDNCIRCKHTNCVELCPVDCFHEGENMLMIHPDECTDCGVFVPECPAEAIFADTDTVPNLAGWLALNSKYSARRLHIVTMKPPPDAAADWDGVADKFADHFSPNSE